MIGILGGTFDPVHYGHLRAAIEAREALRTTDFRLLPAGTPPHRAAPAASARHRLAMLRLAAEGRTGFSVDDREVRRRGNSYMVDTLAEIRGEVGDLPLVLIIGQDAANALDSWHQWRRLFDLAHLAILRRPGAGHAFSGELLDQWRQRRATDAALLRQRPAGRMFPLEITQLDISSTDIRRRLAAGRSTACLMPDSVIAYVEEHHLYFAGRAGKG